MNSKFWDISEVKNSPGKKIENAFYRESGFLESTDILLPNLIIYKK